MREEYELEVLEKYDIVRFVRTFHIHWVWV